MSELSQFLEGYNFKKSEAGSLNKYEIYLHKDYVRFTWLKKLNEFLVDIRVFRLSEDSEHKLRVVGWI